MAPSIVGIVAVVLITAVFPLHALTLPSPTATTINGTVRGIHLPTFNQDAFLGVPFAQPPTGDLRLRHPVPYETKYHAYNATTLPPSCPGYAGFDVGIGPLSEDCLYLNIVRPQLSQPIRPRGGRPAPTQQKLPVLVWIYGGGFDAGGVADPRYNMSYLVSQSAKIGKPIIGVSINYRVGGWGFLASKEVLSAGAANIGLYDQRLALQWIHENIAGFGGDPAKVTIWGESAGAFSVGYQTLAFNGQHDGLFRAAIMHSGTALGQPVQNASTIGEKGGFQEQYDTVAATVGCSNATDTLQCIREQPYDTLFDAFSPQVYTPVIDGSFISRPPSESFRNGLVANVAILAGSNTDEGTASFWGPRGLLNTTDQVSTWIKTLNGGGLDDEEVGELLGLYPDDPAQGCPFNTGSERFADQGFMYKRGAAISGDINVHAGRRMTTEYFAKQGGRAKTPVYSYRFDQPPWNDILELIATVPPVYSTHYSEVRSILQEGLLTVPE